MVLFFYQKELKYTKIKIHDDETTENELGYIKPL